VRGHVSAAFAFAKAALLAERFSDAGRVNVIGIAFAFILVLGSAAADLIQSIARIWKPHYETGLPSTLAFIGLFAGMFLICVLILALVPPQQSDGRSDGD
jgi:hypothetical protein